MAKTTITNVKIKKAIAANLPTNVFESPVEDRQTTLFPVDTTGTIVGETPSAAEPKMTIAQKLHLELELRNMFAATLNRYSYKIAVTTSEPAFMFEIRNGLSEEIALKYFQQNGYDTEGSFVKKNIKLFLNPFWKRVQKELCDVNTIAKKKFCEAIASGASEVSIKREEDLPEKVVETLVHYFETEGIRAKFYNKIWKLSF